MQLGLHHLLALQHLRVQLELQQVLEQVVLLHLRAQVLQLQQVLRALVVSITFLPFKSTICIT